MIVTLVFLAHTAAFFNWRIISRLENILYDTRVLLTMPGDVDPSIVIVDIDEKSLAEIGRWPWGRDRLAKIVDELFDYYHVAMVGFDVVFAEPDESSGLRILEQLAKTEFADLPAYRERLNDLRTRLDFDSIFVNSISNRPIILGYFFNSAQDGQKAVASGQLPEPSLKKSDVQGKNIYARQATGYGANLPEIQNAALASGHFTPAIDEDGVIRRVPMLTEYHGNYYESLSLAMTRNILGVERVEPVFAEQGPADYPDLEWLKLDNFLIPVDVNVQALIPFKGKRNSFPYVSAVDVLRGRADPSVLEGVIVIVGTTTQGLFDLRTTPVGKEYPGVEIHANMIAGILDQSIKKRPAFTQGAEFLQLLLTGIILAVLLPLLSPIMATSVALFVLVISILVNYAFWEFANLVLPLASLVVMLAVIFLLNMSYGFFIERRGKGQLSTLFGQYVPPELVDEMNVDPTTYTQRAQSREMTVFFTDVRNFTSISEGLSPDELSDLMDEYLTPMTKLIHENLGTIDKYMGDAIIAFWGAPLDDPDHARHALITGLAMLERLNAIREEFKERDWPEIRIGVGINTGEMSVGDMGSQFRMAYTVLGDAVNLGSRLEGLTKGYGVEIIVSESTKAAVDDFVYRKLDIVKVKGKDQPIAIYEPLAPVTEVSDDEFKELVLHEQAIKNYLNQDWDASELQFRNLLTLSPEMKLYQLYIDRIAEFRLNPPGDDWDGVYTHTTK
ncbi:MAG: adenylate/guanylate cyclase domain-containing protein [Gammaproteobacteria bacterium]|nr:adenylate/guanylate cyclase domain-containing protein [Gammaproteobacteria bacterium]